MKKKTGKILLLLSFIPLISTLVCTGPANPFQNINGVRLLISVLKKNNRFNYSVNDSVPFEVTILLPHLVKKIGIDYDEHGEVDETVITTDKPDNQIIHYYYKYMETGRKDVKFTITFRESGNIRDTIFNIDIGIEPKIQNEENLVITGDINRGKRLILTVEHEEFSRATYNWFKDKTLLMDKDKQSLIFNPLMENDTGEYYCVVTTKWGERKSKPIMLKYKNTIDPPAIQRHPQSIQVTPGNSATFIISATGEQLEYQWQKNEQDIPEANQSGYEINNLKIGDNATYRCIVFNNGGKDTSDNAKLEILKEETSPEITKHPEDQEADEENYARFSIEVTGTNLKYQWFKDDNEIINAVSAILEMGPVFKEDDSAKYHCVVSNDQGEVVSKKAVLTVNRVEEPEITEDLKDTSVTAGEPATFEIKAKGDKLQYQWFENGKEIDQATDYIYIIESASLQDNGKKYSCIVSNPGGKVISSEATLTIVKDIMEPEITEQPQNQEVTAGNDAKFIVIAKGSNLTYQWQENQKDISGATGSEYIHKNAKKEDDGNKIRCSISNSAGKVTSKEVTLKVIEKVVAPKIEDHPDNAAVKENNDAVFSIKASGTNLTYQWLKDGKALSGEDQSSLKIKSVKKDNNNTNYTCVVKNSAGEAKSKAAALTVLYQVSFKGKGSSIPSEKYYAEGHSVSLPKLTLDDFIFKGWSIDDDGTAEYKPDTKYTMQSKSVTFYAIWENNVKTYFVRLIDGNKEERFEWEEGVKITLSNRSKDGHDFLGWEDKDTKEFYKYKGDNFITVNRNYIFVAQWKVKVFTLTFINDGKKEIKEYNWGTWVGIFDLPSTSQKIFMGWEEQESKKIYLGNKVGVTVLRNYTFNALWN